MDVKNLGSFIEALKEKQSAALRLARDGADTRALVGKLFDFWYRGEGDFPLPLRPKVFRDKYNERDLTNRFRVLSKSRHSDLPDYNNYGLFLSLMQHYRLPTRLLDWSTSPLVALYFAVEKFIYEPQSPPTDTFVWILNPYKLNLIELDDGTTPSIEGELVRKFLRPAFTDYGPGSRRYKRDPRRAYLSVGAKKVCAVMGTETDARIFAQQGSFTIHTSPRPLSQMSRANEYLDRIVVPAASVRTIAEELLLCGFRRSTLFPDLTNLADDLAARYT